MKSQKSVGRAGPGRLPARRNFRVWRSAATEPARSTSSRAVSGLAGSRRGSPLALCRSRQSEPGGQRFRESEVGSVSDPGNVSVGSDQHGSGSGDRAKYRKLPHTDIFSIDQLDRVSRWSDVKAAGLTEVEQHRPGVVQQLEDSERAVGGHEVQIGHPASEQGVALAEVVTNGQPGGDP